MASRDVTPCLLKGAIGLAVHWLARVRWEGLGVCVQVM